MRAKHVIIVIRRHILDSNKNDNKRLRCFSLSVVQNSCDGLVVESLKLFWSVFWGFSETQHGGRYHRADTTLVVEPLSLLGCCIVGGRWDVGSDEPTAVLME